MRHHTLYIYVMLLPLLSVNAQQAQQQAQMRQDTLHEVSVYARANATAELTPTQRLSRSTLQGMGALSVADAVRFFSGVQLKDYGGIGGLKTLDIRAMGTNHMSVCLDGMPLSNAQNGQIDLGRYAVENLEEICLYNGQKSDLLQTARDFGSSATLYLRTRRPTFAHGRTHALRATLRTGSFGLWNPVLSWDKAWSPNVSTTLSGEHTCATGRYRFRYRRVLPDGEVAYDTTATRHNADIRATRIEGTLFAKKSAALSLMAKAYYYASQRGLPGAIVNNVWKHAQRQWDRNLLLQTTLRHYATDEYTYELHAKYTHDRLRYLSTDPTTMYVDNSFAQQELYLSTAHRLGLTKTLQLSLSADYQFNTLRGTPLNTRHPMRHSMFWAAAARWNPTPLSLMFSLQGSHILQSRTSSTAMAKGYNRLSPALYVSLRLNNEITLRLYAKQSFRMPTFNDIYYTDTGITPLRPETARQANIGLLWSHKTRQKILRHIEIKADAYANQIKDKIVGIPKNSGQYRWMMMNIGRVRILGSELSAQGILKPYRHTELNLRAAYTYEHATDRTDPNDKITYNGQIAYIPRHSLSLTATATYAIWQLHYSFIYASKRYRSSANTPQNLEQSWYTSDLSLSLKPKIKNIQTEIQLGINNLLNQQYELVPNYPMPGRNYRLTLRLEL